MSDSEPITVAQYLADGGVTVVPSGRVDAERAGFGVAGPAGWESAPDGQFPGATHVLIEPHLVESGFAPNAVLLVGTLSSTIDATALLSHTHTDARALPDWREQEADEKPFRGSPSSFLRGTFSAEQWTLAVTTRYVVVENRAGQWLVQLTVTALADQLEKLAFDIAFVNDSLTIG